MVENLVQLPIWLFILLTTSVTAIIALIGLFFKHKFFAGVVVRPEDNQSANILVRLVSTLLTVLLAFMVISIWKDYDTQRNNTELEACVLGNLYRDARGSNPKVEADLQGLLTTYTRTIVEHAWPEMKKGKESKIAWQAFNNLYGYVIRINPESKKEEMVYSRLINHMNQLAKFRRLRHLRNQSPSMPGFMTGIIFLASFLNVCFSYLLKVENKKMHQLMVAMGGIMLGFAFALILLLNYPYRGSAMVSSDPINNLLDDVFPMADVTLVPEKHPVQVN